jgi:hypothetical protein
MDYRWKKPAFTIMRHQTGARRTTARFGTFPQRERRAGPKSALIGCAAGDLQQAATRSRQAAIRSPDRQSCG